MPQVLEFYHVNDARCSHALACWWELPASVERAENLLSGATTGAYSRLRFD
jgi:hypothetical protein